MAKLLLLLAVSIGLFALSICYPSGAPQESCIIFSANHTDENGRGHLPQTGPPEYTIKSPSTIQSGGKMTVTIEGINGELFKGFLIQGRDQNTHESVGKFTAQGDVQTLDCNGPGSSDAATHTDRNDKSEVDLEWTAPASFEGNVYFKAVIVKRYEIFWNDVRSAAVTVE